MRPRPALALALAAALAHPAAAPVSSAGVAAARTSWALTAALAGSSCGWQAAAQRLARDLPVPHPTSPTPAAGDAVDPRVAAVRAALRAAGITAGSTPAPGCGAPAAASVAAATSAPVVALVSAAGASIDVGSSAQLQQAIAAARPGDTIRLAPGRYTPVVIAGRSGTAAAPITLTGPREAVIDGGSATGGYALHLQGASFWQLSGFTVTGGGKGVVVDHGQHNLLDGLDIGRTGDEAVHLRANSSDNTLQRSTVHDTGLFQPGFGEGVYLGSARSNWPSVSAGRPDLSMRNRVVANTFAAITAENVDVKEATSGALITGNRFDGSAISGVNYADSVVDVKGYDNTVTDNITTGTSPALRTIITTHVITTPATSGCGNTITGNTAAGALPPGGLVAVDPKCAATGGQG
ncbi:right-handed parallel beta-helix repeat-containing protein [uncultured Pseudonocardia sp.]|jgi:hypothetical protein|uniref:right-handed parallel beta-helix repeat-containing protein n=1 Tax=uncultured Pseudonocardia sp. TaxID=211455 RepID=UPI0026026A8F|nr:right-handed parallel beta-helix repeat-containing protein [uncultured Pseudonocardia sp.]